MEDKSFELLTKMYGEFTEFKKDMTEFKKDMTEFKKDMTNFSKETGSRLTKIEITLENDIKSNLQALHERAEGNTVKHVENASQLTNINNKLDYLALSVNSQDKRLEVVETIKRKNIK